MTPSVLLCIINWLVGDMQTFSSSYHLIRPFLSDDLLIPSAPTPRSCCVMSDSSSSVLQSPLLHTRNPSLSLSSSSYIFPCSANREWRMFADSDSAHAISLVVVSRMSAFPSRRPTPFRRVVLHDPAMSNTRSLPPFFTPIVMLGLFATRLDLD